MARNPSAKPNPAKIATETAACLRLKLDGRGVREIGTILGMAPTTVQARLQAAYDDLVLPAADEVRQIELARLDRWQWRLEERITEGEDPVRVVPVGLQVQARRARLLGLDAPERQEMTVTELPQSDPAVDSLLSEARQAAL